MFVARSSEPVNTIAHDLLFGSTLYQRLLTGLILAVLFNEKIVVDLEDNFQDTDSAKERFLIPLFAQDKGHAV